MIQLLFMSMKFIAQSEVLIETCLLCDVTKSIVMDVEISICHFFFRFPFP